MQPSVAAAAAWAHLLGAIAANLLPLLLLAVAYCTLLIRPLPPGAPKLLLSLPVIALFLFAPLRFNAVSVAGNIGFVLSWLSNFKLLAASGGRGPLAMHGISAAQYAALLVFPFYNTKPGGSCRPQTSMAPTTGCTDCALHTSQQPRAMHSGVPHERPRLQEYLFFPSPTPSCPSCTLQDKWRLRWMQVGWRALHSRPPCLQRSPCTCQNQTWGMDCRCGSSTRFTVRRRRINWHDRMAFVVACKTDVHQCGWLCAAPAAGPPGPLPSALHLAIDRHDARPLRYGNSGPTHPYPFTPIPCWPL